MKRELPIAVVLLALGCWLTLRHERLDSRPDEADAIAAAITSQFAHSGEAFGGSATAANGSKPVHSPADGSEKRWIPGNSQSPNSDIVAAAYQRNPAQARASAGSISSAGPVTPSAGALSVRASSRSANEGAHAWLAQTRATLATAKPFDASLRMESWHFGTHVTAHGKYYQQGQGGHACRLDLEFRQEPQTIQLTQICDGRFMYQVTSRGGQREIAYVDLGRLTQQSRRSHATSPQGAMALGGLSGLVEQVMEDFDLEILKPDPIKFCGDPVMVVRGRLKPAKKAVLARYAALVRGDSDPKRSGGLPDHVPDEVELYLGADEFMPGFPYRITFLRSPSRTESSSALPLVQFNILELNKRSQIPAEMFLVDSGDAPTHDLTEEYASQRHTLSGLADADGDSGN